MGPFMVEAVHKGIEARLLLQDVRRGGAGRFRFEGEVHPLVPAVLLGMSRRDALEANAEPQPPDGELA